MLVGFITVDLARLKILEVDLAVVDIDPPDPFIIRTDSYWTFANLTGPVIPNLKSHTRTIKD